MSLAAFALRVCAVQAITGATLAGAAVVDSPIDMADRAETASTPSIFVFSDLERITDIETRAIYAGSTKVDLAFMIVLPAVFKATIGGVTLDFDDGQAGAAVAIDILYRQIIRALLDESTIWGRLFCGFAQGIDEAEAHAYVLPVGKAGAQRKLPARAIRLVIDPLNNPPMGEAPSGLWAELVTAMEGDADLAPLAPLIAAAIQGDALPDWRVDALELGDTVRDAIELGYGPLGGGAGDDVVTMGEATIDATSPGAPAATFTIVEGQLESFEP